MLFGMRHLLLAFSTLWRFWHRSAAMRQAGGSEILIRTLAMGYPSGTVLERHTHSWTQLAYASDGVMTVHTDEGTWVVPPHRAVWIPAGVTHSIAMSGAVSMRTLYLAPEVVEGLPRRCSVVN